MADLEFEKREQLKQKPTDESKLGFGKYFTDYMLQIDYIDGQGWHNPRITPYAPIEFDPATVCLHYGQLVFEGMKAYKTDDGKIVLFRPFDNISRLNQSAKRLCIPEIDVAETVKAIAELVKTEKDWVPSSSESSLYIRPFIFATEKYVGVRPSNSYTLLAILSPVGSYYPEGISPTKIYVEDEYVRAVRGGVGQTKCAGNYAASLASQEKAHKNGYTQVLWLDGVERKYIEEIGTSNAFFVIGDEIVTPKLNGSILPGITRDSTIKVLRHMGHNVFERDITIDELVAAYENGLLKEAFATGTAAVVSPIGELKYKDKVMVINDFKTGEIAQKVYDTLTGIQKCKQEDPFGWVYPID